MLLPQLSYLLSQKQKRASYEGALKSVLYARQRAKIAVESARQGETLTLFTVVTIVFVKPTDTPRTWYLKTIVSQQCLQVTL